MVFNPSILNFILALDDDNNNNRVVFLLQRILYVYDTVKKIHRWMQTIKSTSFHQKQYYSFWSNIFDSAFTKSSIVEALRLYVASQANGNSVQKRKNAIEMYSPTERQLWSTYIWSDQLKIVSRLNYGIDIQLTIHHINKSIACAHDSTLHNLLFIAITK